MNLNGLTLVLLTDSCVTLTTQNTVNNPEFNLFQPK